MPHSLIAPTAKNANTPTIICWSVPTSQDVLVFTSSVVCLEGEIDIGWMDVQYEPQKAFGHRVVGREGLLYPFLREVSQEL